MNRDEIIAHLYQQAWLKEAASNIGKQNRDDLLQETVIVLLEKPAQQLEQIHASGGLRWYTITIMQRLHVRLLTKEKYYEPLEGISIEDENYIKDRLLGECCDKVLADNSLYWFDRKVFELYLSGQSGNTISKQTKIHHTWIQASIRNIKKQIRNEYHSRIDDDTLHGMDGG